MTEDSTSYDCGEIQRTTRHLRCNVTSFMDANDICEVLVQKKIVIFHLDTELIIPNKMESQKRIDTQTNRTSEETFSENDT